MKRKLDDIDKQEVKEADNDEDEVEIDAEELQWQKSRRKCPYLDTIDRQALDFDSEKLCSVTLTNMNVYVCLVCGKYFQGRGKATPAYTHSVQAAHFVFMNLSSGRTFCLPDGYEVFDSSLQDAQQCLSPKYTIQDLAQLNSNTSLARDVHGVSYLPGFVGLNNLNCTDYINSLLHALAHVTPFRDFWLQGENYEMVKSNLVQQLGLTLRKMWSPYNFKSTVSPQELVQALSVESQRRFSLGQRAECIELLVWLLATLHKGLGKAAAAPGAPSKPLKGRGPAERRSVVYEPFQGLVEVTSLTKRLVSSAQELQGKEQMQVENGQVEGDGEWVRSVQMVPFTHLSVDIPPCPLFRDSEGGLVIPQVPLFQLLQKFDGATWTDTMTSEAHVRRQYRIVQLPRYLVLHLVRFTRNNFYLEKNPTIVTFPVRNLELRDFITPQALEEARQRGESRHIAADLPTKSVAELRRVIQECGSDLHLIQLQRILPDNSMNGSTGTSSGSAAGAVEVTAQQKADLVVVATAAVERAQMQSVTKYDLLANICHSSEVSSSSAKGGVTVGDLNMLMGQSTSAAQKSRARAAGTVASAAVAGSGSAGAVNAGAGAAAQAVGAVAAHTSASTAAANNRVLNEGSYKVHLQHKATGQWFEIQDLHVDEISPQQIGVSESNILIYEKKSAK